MLLLTDSISCFSHFKTSGHSLLVFRKVPHRDEQFVFHSITAAGLYLGLGTSIRVLFAQWATLPTVLSVLLRSQEALRKRECSAPLRRCVGVIPLLLSRTHHLGVFKSSWPVVQLYIMAGEWICVIIDYFCVGTAEVFGLLLFRWISSGHFVLIHSQSWMWVFGRIYSNFILFTQGHASLQNCYNWLIVLLCQVTKYSAFFYSTQEDLVSLHRSKLLK